MLPYVWALEMLEAVGEALEADTAGGKPARACVYNGGTAVAYDDCCDGQLWVAWGRTIPSDWKQQSFGRYPTASPRAVAGFSKCLTMVAIDYEVGILRCAPTLDEHGNPPSAEEIEASARQMHEDAWVILRATLTQLDAWEHGGTFVSWEAQVPIDDNAGCVGSLLRFSVGHPICPTKPLA